MRRVKPQRGAAMVEFAIVAIVFFMMLFGIIEIGRALFEYNALQEAMRRGARVAAVCPASQKGIDAAKAVVLFNSPVSPPPTSGILGLTPNNIVVEYLNSSMSTVLVSSASGSAPTNVTGPPYDADGSGNPCCIAFVRVSLTAFTHRWFIPLFTHVFNVPSMSTLMPAESLGRVSNDNPVTKRCCPYNTSSLCTP